MGAPLSLFGLFIVVLIVVVGVIALIVSLLIGFISHHHRKIVKTESSKKQYLKIAFSQQDLLAQLYFLLSLCFLALTLLAVNRDIGSPFSWQTILLFTSLLGLAGAYYFKAIYVLTFSLLGLPVWWVAQAGIWAREQNVKPIIVLVGAMLFVFLYFLASGWHEKNKKYKRFALIYLVLSIVPLNGVLFVFSTKVGLNILGNLTKGETFFSSSQLGLSFFILLLLMSAAVFYSFYQKSISSYELLVVVLLIALFVFIVFLPEQKMFITAKDYVLGPMLSAVGIFWAVAFNVLTFLELVGIIFLGYIKKEDWLVNIGSLFLFLLIIIKYFDWFFSFLDKSLFFIGAGILLFVVGRFMEKGRQYILKDIKSGKDEKVNLLD